MGAQVTVLYFASLRDAAGVDAERIETDAADLRGVYDALKSRLGLAFLPQQLRVAVNGEFARWEQTPRDGDEIAFIPPVSGG